MANEEQLSILKQGVDIWNKWREENPEIEIRIGEANLREMSLAQANLSHSHLKRADFFRSNLREADLSGSDLEFANLSGAYLRQANLHSPNLSRADLGGAHIRSANLSKANLQGSNLQRVQLQDANLDGADFTEAKLIEADISNASLVEAVLYEADLTGAKLIGSNLIQANLQHASLNATNLMAADLSKANLMGVSLVGAFLVGTNIDKARISESYVYAGNVWDLKGEFEEQKDLIITPQPASLITVDNIKVAQFIYMILNNGEIRGVINTLTSKTVLILGRFAIPERKAILDALRNKLREYNLLPIVFDFDRPTDKDFTETIKTLAGLSYFVIADVTNPKSFPLELQATVPDYQIPFVPIIEEGESPFAMMIDLQKKYNWVLDTLSYNSIDTLIKALKPAIIDPAIQKHNELRVTKARAPKIRSASDFVEDKGME